MSVSRVIRICVVAAVAAACGGCPPATPMDATVRHHLSSPDDVRALGRVVLVELAHDDAHTQMAEEMTTALYKALQSRGLFHVSRVGRDDPVCRDLPLGRDEPLTLGELSAIRRRLRCDAVLTGRLNAYAPHPRMQVGLYLNLLDLRDGKVVWGVDHVWDTTERRTRRQLKRFYRDRMSGPYGPVDWKLATMSPKHFAKFVAEQAAGTLDDVNAETRKQASVIDRLRGEV